MRILIFIIFIFLNILPYTYEVKAASYKSLQKKCKKIMIENHPKINVFYNFGNLQINENKNSNEIKKISEKYSPKIDLTINGYTLLNHYNKINLSAKRVLLDDTNYCIYPESINYFIGYENNIMYLSSEMKKDSCQYQQVKRHEEAHVDYAHTILLFSAKAIKNKIQQITLNLKPIVSTNYKENHAQTFIDIYDNLLQPTLTLFQGALSEQQKKLDTLENYKFETSICLKNN